MEKQQAENSLRFSERKDPGKEKGTAVITAKSGNKTQKFRISVEKTAKIRIMVNGKTFTAELENNKTAKAFMKMLPMTLSMEELNGNEKFKYLD